MNALALLSWLLAAPSPAHAQIELTPSQKSGLRQIDDGARSLRERTPEPEDLARADEEAAMELASHLHEQGSVRVDPRGPVPHYLRYCRVSRDSPHPKDDRLLLLVEKDVPEWIGEKVEWVELRGGRELVTRRTDGGSTRESWKYVVFLNGWIREAEYTRQEFDAFGVEKLPPFQRCFGPGSGKIDAELVEHWRGLIRGFQCRSGREV